MTIRSLAVLAAALASTTAATAADFSFTGTFARDNDARAVSFTLAAPGTVTFASYGFAGGTNARGDTVGAGGFDPVATLYDGAGNALSNADIAGGDTDIGHVLATDGGVANDFYKSFDLAAGTYTVRFAQYDNFGGSTFGDSVYRGQPNFAGGFVDSDGAQRTGAYAFDILGADSVGLRAVPEAATWGMLIAGFGLVGAVQRRRRPAAVRAPAAA